MLAVLGYRGLGATEYRVLGGLAWCDGDNGAYPYQKTLAAELSMSQRAVNHAIRKLRKRGIVVVTKQGPSKPALYTIHYPAAPAEGLRVKAEGRHAESRRVNEAEDTPKVRTKTRRTSAYRTGLNRTLPPNGTDSRRRQEPERSNPVPAAVDDRPTLASARAQGEPRSPTVPASAPADEPRTDPESAAERLRRLASHSTHRGRRHERRDGKPGELAVPGCERRKSAPTASSARAADVDARPHARPTPTRATVRERRRTHE